MYVCVCEVCEVVITFHLHYHTRQTVWQLAVWQPLFSSSHSPVALHLLADRPTDPSPSLAATTTTSPGGLSINFPVSAKVSALSDLAKHPSLGRREVKHKFLLLAARSWDKVVKHSYAANST